MEEMEKGINRGNERIQEPVQEQEQDAKEFGNKQDNYSEEELLIWNLWREKNRKKTEFFQRTGSKELAIKGQENQGKGG